MSAAAGIYTQDPNNPCSILSETGSLADSDIRDIDLHSSAVTGLSQDIEVSVHQGPVEVLPAIDAGQAPTMDNFVPGLQCATLITCMYATPLASTSNQLFLAHSTSAVAPLRGLDSSQDKYNC